MKKLLFLFFTLTLFVNISVLAQQKYATRTGHLYVKSDNRITSIEADNYQVASVFDATTGAINFIGLLKSFEFRLGAADQVFSSKKVDVSAHPNIKFEGKITNVTNIDFNKPGNHTIKVEGILYIWDEKRLTSATGKIRINEDLSINATSNFDMVIEKESMEKANRLMKEKLPDVLAIDVNSLGISRTIEVRLDAKYNPRNYGSN